MTLIMAEHVWTGDALTVDEQMQVRCARNASEPFIGYAAQELQSGQYAKIIQNETARENLRLAWLRYGQK